MANEIRTKFDGLQYFTCTLAGLASGNARQSTIVTNPNARFAALISIRIQTGNVAPTTGTVYELFLIRDDGSGNYKTDMAGTTDAAITISNAQLIGTIVVNNSANAYFTGDFDTAPLGPLGANWGIAIRNSTDQAIGVTESNMCKEWQYYLPEIQ
jgi:hypothetical protein